MPFFDLRDASGRSLRSVMAASLGEARASWAATHTPGVVDVTPLGAHSARNVAPAPLSEADQVDRIERALAQLPGHSAFASRQAALGRMEPSQIARLEEARLAAGVAAGNGVAAVGIRRTFGTRHAGDVGELSQADQIAERARSGGDWRGSPWGTRRDDAGGAVELREPLTDQARIDAAIARLSRSPAASTELAEKP